MEIKISQSLKLSAWMSSDKLVRKPSGSLQFSQSFRVQQRLSVLLSGHLHYRRAATGHIPVGLKVSCSSQKIPASVVESESVFASFDEDVILKNKSAEIEPYLNGRCIYLVGMMGSGKTTVGRILSEVLGYSFFDSDSLIEQAVGGATVAEIFKLRGESFFRDNETEVLGKLSVMHRLVVSTGGGAVIQPINWKYMQKGISLWLDVPLDALARRIVSVGTVSRPLLHQESSDAYAKTLKRLSSIFEERGDDYAKASAKVSLESIAAKLGYTDVCSLTPTIIAIEALVQIEKCLKKKVGMVHQ